MITDPRLWPLAFALLLVAALLDWLFPMKWSGPEPHMAVADWLIQIGVIIISSIISRALAPKPKAPDPQRADVPEVKDGKRVLRIYGANWIDEPGQLAMKQVDPPDPIKQKVGKKG